MSNTLHIDYESYSEADLSDVGAYRYAEDPSTEITLCGIALNDEEPVIWDRFVNPRDSMQRQALDLIELATDPETIIYAHNAPFEIAVSKYLWRKTFGLKPPRLEQWRCTMAMSRRAAMPAALGKLAEALGLAEQKDEAGKRLIKLFCELQTAGKLKGQRIFPTDEGMVTVLGKKISIAEAWEMFRQYCLQDVRTERTIGNHLHQFELKGKTLRGFQFDLRMNDRGIPVNTVALERATKIIETTTTQGVERFQELTGLKPSQTGKTLAWLQERGYPGENLQAATMEAVLEDNEMDGEALEALTIRSQLSFAAVKKVPSMLAAANTDGRVRGCLVWSGAIRTHRWAGRIIQPQNFKKPVKGTEEFYKTLCDTDKLDAETISMIWGNPFEWLACSIRHFIHPKYGLYDSDFSSVEAVITPWLARQNDLVEQFRNLFALKKEAEIAKAVGKDTSALKTRIAATEPYTIMAGKIFSKKTADVVGDERFVGKQAILGAGFQCGWEKFQIMCAGYGRNLEDELCQHTIKTYRETNDRIASVWKAFQIAAVDAIENPGSVFTVRGRVRLFVTNVGFEALVMKLPSGHCLIYPRPEVETIWMFKKQKYKTEAEANRLYRYHKSRGTLEDNDRVWQTKQVTFFGPDPKTEQWGRQSTYGGKLFENGVQALCGDFLTHGILKAEEAGFPVFMIIHDQALSEKQNRDKEEFRAALCSLPHWAEDFPLDASCDILPFYTKDL